MTTSNLELRKSVVRLGDCLQRLCNVLEACDLCEADQEDVANVMTDVADAYCNINP